MMLEVFRQALSTTHKPSCESLAKTVLQVGDPSEKPAIKGPPTPTVQTEVLSDPVVGHGSGCVVGRWLPQTGRDATGVVASSIGCGSMLH